MSNHDSDFKEESPLHTVLYDTFTWGMFALLGFATLQCIAYATAPLTTILFFAVVWFGVIFIYRHRRSIFAWNYSASVSDISGIKDFSSQFDNQPKSEAKRTIYRAFDYSEADNESLQPLSPSEHETFTNMIEKFNKP